MATSILKIIIPIQMAGTNSSSSSFDSLRLAIFAIVAFLMLSSATSDFARDRAECGDELVGLATCIAYVEGSGKAPTPDCCIDFKKVVSKSFKCLCVLIEDRDEPELGIKFNVTRALSLPSLCAAPVIVSDCIRVLKLPAHSKESEIFKQFESAIGATLKGSKGKENSTKSEHSDSNRAARRNVARWLGLEMTGGLRISSLLQLVSLLVLLN